MSYVCAYSSVQLDTSRVEKEFTPLELSQGKELRQTGPFQPSLRKIYEKIVSK